MNAILFELFWYKVFKITQFPGGFRLKVFSWSLTTSNIVHHGTQPKEQYRRTIAFRSLKVSKVHEI